MIELLQSKGFIMSAIIVVFILAFAYWIMFWKLETPSHNQNIIPNSIKEQINAHYGHIICMNVDVDAIGFVYDDFTDEANQVHSPSYLVVIKVKLKRQDKCLSVLIDDLSETNIQLAIHDLIKKIDTAQDDLRISC